MAGRLRVSSRAEIQIAAEVQDGRQAQGQGQVEWSGERLQGQDMQGSKTRRLRKREARKKQELTGQTLVSLTNKTNWQQTSAKTQVYVHRVTMGKMGNTWRGGEETRTRTVETGQGVTEISKMLKNITRCQRRVPLLQL
jgi:hypothetical protein